jgi:hypothetical protein
MPQRSALSLPLFANGMIHKIIVLRGSFPIQKKIRPILMTGLTTKKNMKNSSD